MYQLMAKNFDSVPIINKNETYVKIIEMSKSNDYTTGNLLGYDYFSNHYRLIVKEMELENLIENNKLILLANLKKNMERKCFSLLKNQKKKLLDKKFCKHHEKQKHKKL